MLMFFVTSVSLHGKDNGVFIPDIIICVKWQFGRVKCLQTKTSLNTDLRFYQKQKGRQAV